MGFQEGPRTLGLRVKDNKIKSKDNHGVDKRFKSISDFVLWVDRGVFGAGEKEGFEEKEYQGEGDKR